MKKTQKKLFLKATKLNFILFVFILLNESIIKVQAQTCAPAPAGLVSWYRAENNALDVTSMHNGVLRGGTAFASGMVGQAFNFDGVDDDVDLGNWNAGTQWSLEAWVNPSSIPSERDSIFGGNSECADWAIGFDNGQFLARIKPSDSCSAEVVSSVTPTAGTWHHVAVTSDGLTTRIYVDGAERASGTVAPNYMPTADRIRIGSDTCCGNYFHGLVDEAAIYNRALSAAEIQAIFIAGSAGKCFAPTAASVSINGRVIAEKGRGVAKARVSLISRSGEIHTASTNFLGYYRFANLPAGETYIFSVAHKLYQFQPQVFFLTEEVEGFNITAMP
ncbi:MAG: carboxypeptidase regulatory-like domain-containing protein [Acidobacteriota bacterium]|nr:carboxypeptidase regulatory-like domain-containing protein [Acidobacteriota bacterium]